jgi:hypothetical protein
LAVSIATCFRQSCRRATRQISQGASSPSSPYLSPQCPPPGSWKFRVYCLSRTTCCVAHPTNQ